MDDCNTMEQNYQFADKIYDELKTSENNLKDCNDSQKEKIEVKQDFD